MRTRGLVIAAYIVIGAAVPAPISWSAAVPLLNTDQLKLVKASGVPYALNHSYKFGGKLIWVETKEEFSVEGVGIWKGSPHYDVASEASESLSFQGNIVGKLVATFKCQAISLPSSMKPGSGPAYWLGDPWLFGIKCNVVNVQYAHAQGKQLDWPAIVKQIGRPISAGAVTLAAATELSKQSAAQAPPPPPPPASEPVVSRAQQPKGIASTAPGQQAILPKPDLIVTGVSAIVESSCNPGLPAVKVQVAVKNAGTAPFPALPGNHVIYVKADKGLQSNGIEIPALNPGQVYPPPRGFGSQGVPIKAAVPLSQLAGTSHSLEIQLNSLKKAEESSYANNTKTVQVGFPAGYCQPKVTPGTPAAGTQTPGQLPRLNPLPAPPSRAPLKLPGR